MAVRMGLQMANGITFSMNFKGLKKVSGKLKSGYASGTGSTSKGILVLGLSFVSIKKMEKICSLSTQHLLGMATETLVNQGCSTKSVGLVGLITNTETLVSWLHPVC